MTGIQEQRVLAVLAEHGPCLPIVVLARLLELPPSRLIPLLDELYDAGLVTTGRERGTVVLMPMDALR